MVETCEPWAPPGSVPPDDWIRCRRIASTCGQDRGPSLCQGCWGQGGGGAGGSCRRCCKAQACPAHERERVKGPLAGCPSARRRARCWPPPALAEAALHGMGPSRGPPAASLGRLGPLLLLLLLLLPLLLLKGSSGGQACAWAACTPGAMRWFGCWAALAVLARRTPRTACSWWACRASRGGGRAPPSARRVPSGPQQLGKVGLGRVVGCKAGRQPAC
jgi:hypothetical protein